MASPYSTEAMTRSDEGDVAVLTYSPLDIGSIIAAVSSPEAGAIATFLGQTRNNFDTKVVTHLEYEVGLLGIGHQDHGHRPPKSEDALTDTSHTPSYLPSTRRMPSRNHFYRGSRLESSPR
ncbi:SubName: Full=Related to molybdopterin synthase large subunit {ECO:0000313/EMBL:CCA69129.1} [Serendipita indica DSM 11827]|nr:SubName: Full=Related to molybdopterin synthase large subunit {ECO:0000313/EMBL:CCA69129.1} [Serendipita indica DSM 11827]